MMMLHEELDLAMPPFPPSTVDIDRLIAGNRRAARVRATLGGVGAAGVVAGVAGLTVLLAGGASAPPTPGVTAGATNVLDELDAEVKVALGNVAPEATLDLPAISRPSPDDGCGTIVDLPPTSATGEPGPTGLPSAMCRVVPPEKVRGYNIHVGTEQGVLTVQVWQQARAPISSCTVMNANLPSPYPSQMEDCAESTQNGVRILERSGDPWGNGEIMYEYTVVRPDHVVVDVVLYGYFAGPNHTDYHLPPLSPEQVRDLALDPAFTP